jgi:UDP-N-acetylmuramoylalanine--D-glutamate ligase
MSQKPPVLYIGKGRSNTAIARYFDSGWAVDERADGVHLYQWKESQWNLVEPLGNRFEDLDWDRLPLGPIVLSPGVDPRRKFFQKLSSREVRELDLFGEIFKGKILAITGSNGKSSATTWLGEAFASALGKERVFVGGNLGVPLFEALDEPKDWAILELSSFQLERLKTFRADWGILLNLSPDHLDRYQDLEDYYSQKWGLMERSFHPIYPGDLSSPKSLPASCVPFSSDTDLRQLCSDILIRVRSETGIELRPGEMKSLSHRLQGWLAKRGVLYINDSKATNEASLLFALERQANRLGRLFLAIGGKDKGTDYQKVIPYLRAGDQILIFGEAGARISRELESQWEGTQIFSSLQNLMNSVPQQLHLDDRLLLSPGAASFDEFLNFEDRGDKFLKWAEEAESSLLFASKSR